MEFKELLLYDNTYISLLEMKCLLSFSTTESSSRTKEGRGGQQMSPELTNKAFNNEIHIMYISKTQ